MATAPQPNDWQTVAHGPWEKYARPSSSQPSDWQTVTAQQSPNAQGPWTRYAQHAPQYTIGDAPTSPAAQPAASFPPLGDLTARPSTPSNWFQDAENDLRSGGSRTFVGRTLGDLQGRGDKGYSGIESGVSPEVADYMGSVPLGLAKAGKGMAESPEGHPWQGLKDMVSGGLQAATIPASFVGPEATSEAATGLTDLIPSRARAGAVLDSIKAQVGDQPVALTRSMPFLERAQQLSERGHGAVTPMDNLYKRVNTVNPLDYSEARDRYSALSNLTGNDRLNATKTLQSQTKQFNQAFRDDIGDVAAAAGRGDDYYNALRQYAQASKLRDLMDTSWGAAKKWAIPTIAGAVGASQVPRILRAFEGR